MKRVSVGTLARFAGGLLAVAVAAGCSQRGGSPTAPSAGAEGTSAAVGAGGTATTSAKPVAGAGSTTVTFAGFNAAELTVSINTETIASLGQPYIDQGKIQLQILVDATGNPVPCDTPGATFVRFDSFSNGGKAPANGLTTTQVDLGDLETLTGGNVKNVVCGDSICIRAHYVTGGGSTKVDTHSSEPTPYDIVCGAGCTLTQGYWKNHYPASWPGSVLVGGLTLGSVSYTAAELEDIFRVSVVGNGLVSLAHQLIAAKLNVENGADDSAIATTIVAADNLIGALVVPPVGSGWLAPADTGALTQALDDFNEGITGPGHCD